MNIDDIMHGDIVGVPTVVLNKETYSVDEVVVEGVVVGFTESGAILEYDSGGDIANTIAADFNPVPVTEGLLEANGFQREESEEESVLFTLQEEAGGNYRKISVALSETGASIDGSFAGHSRVTSTFGFTHDLQHAMRMLGFAKRIKPLYRDGGEQEA